ncbi:MAG: NIPSNAP family protein [Acidobacteriota bacterium]|nr:NIPSNAP family protein [Acidobacteriota bacterium]
MLNRFALVVIIAVAFAAGFVLRNAVVGPAVTVHAAADRVFELRTYTTHPGKLEALKSRFRDHTVKLFEKHGMTNVGYWVPQDGPLAENTLIYIVAHSSREAAKKSWAGFREDPDWVKARTASEKDGPINIKVESVFMNPVDFSAIK